MSEGINGIRVNTIEVDYEIEKRKKYHHKDAESEITFKTGNQSDNKTKYLVSVIAKDFSFKGYLSNTLSKENIGLFTYGVKNDADCYCGQWANDAKNGEGVYYYPTSKDIYIGDWVYNKKEGNGIYLSNENPNVTIELSAHCDYRGNADYNKALSQRRAEAVVHYLIEHGIAADRLTPVGYGKKKPKVVRKKLTEKYPWLKEGDTLTEDFIKKLKKDQQEISNQLNRRTEFIVLRTTYGMFDENGKLKEKTRKTQTKRMNTISTSNIKQSPVYNLEAGLCQ